MPETRVEERRQVLEQLLARMPESLVEARRFIGQRFRREPEPGVLQCMVTIARDPAESGPRREVPRTLLTLRTVADDQLAVMNGEGTATPESLMAAARILIDLEQDLDRINRDLAEALPGLAAGDQEYINGLHQRLVPASDKIMAARVLTRFFDLADRPALHSDGGSSARDGAILLHLIGLDLAAWLDACKTDEGKQVDQDAVLDRLWESLEGDRAAYKLISKSLAASKDHAFVHGPKPLYEQLNTLQRNLFSAYSRLSQVLTAGKDSRVTGKEPGGAGAGANADVLAGITAAEQAAEALHQANEQRRELMDDALRGVHQSRAKTSKLPNYMEQQERSRKRRLLILSICCGVLAVVAVGVNLMLMPAGGPVVDLLPEEFRSAMPLKQATTAAEVMLAETTSDLWEAWTPAEREEHARDLARQAGEKGFTGLWLTDESGRQLAFWEQGKELKLF